MANIIQKQQHNEELVVFLAEYARGILKNRDQQVREALARRQVWTDKVLPLDEAYHIYFQPTKNLALKPIKKYLISQIDAAADFLRDFQISVLGQRTSLFPLYEIEFELSDNLRYSYQFESGKFAVKIPYWQVSSLSRYLSAEKLKNIWHQGRHLQPKSPLYKYWWLVNPMGLFRSSLRSMLMVAIQKQLLSLDQLFVKLGLIEGEQQTTLTSLPSESALDKTDGSFQQTAITYLRKNAKEDKLGVNLELVLRNQSEKIITNLLKRYKENLTNPDHIEELIDTGTLTLQETINQEQSQVDIKMFGFVNVGNYHRIDVDLNLSAGYLKKYIEIVPRKADVKAIQFGFVNVYTIDDITVTPNFHSAMKIDLETAALEKALQELDLVE